MAQAKNAAVYMITVIIVPGFSLLQLGFVINDLHYLGLISDILLNCIKKDFKF